MHDPKSELVDQIYNTLITLVGSSLNSSKIDVLFAASHRDRLGYSGCLWQHQNIQIITYDYYLSPR